MLLHREVKQERKENSLKIIMRQQEQKYNQFY